MQRKVGSGVLISPQNGNGGEERALRDEGMLRGSQQWRPEGRAQGWGGAPGSPW